MTEQRVSIQSEQDRPMSLMEALGIAIAEFELSPWEREQSDYPYMVAYFRGERNLVMLQRNRPTRPFVFQPLKTDHDGYFAEAFDIDEDGRAINGVFDTSVLNGLFRRIDVTDESDDPYHKIGLTPTRFPYVSREFFSKTLENYRQALPGAVGEETGALGQLFAQQQIKDSEQSKSEEVKTGLRKSIIKRYFKESVQGFSQKVGNEHFVITEDEQSPLVIASRSLGIETQILKPNEKWGDGTQSPFEALKDSRGLLPMIISVEGRYSQGRNDPRHGVRLEASYYAAKFPLFAFIDLDRDGRGATGVGRLHSGWYNVRGEDEESIRKLLMKIGIDYLLTTRVRQLAQSLG